jgi:diguanylate cyclase (GGDEF)-like protein/PAS domain S-box-containing protein
MFNKTNISLTKYFYVVIGVIIIFLKITLYNLYLYKTKIEESYYENNIISQKISYESTLDKFSLISKYIFDKEINKKEILELFQKATNSNEESDKTHNKALFYRSLSPIFEYMKRDGIRQLHFQTPDNKSFLRFHNPTRFGDDLSTERPSIKYVNEKKTPISLFETGKFLSGFRNIFPMFNNGEYLGCVEISLTLKSMVDSLEKLDSRKEYHFILNKKLIESKIFEYQKYLYTDSIINSDFVEEDVKGILPDSPRASSDLVKQINKKISIEKEIQKALKEEKFVSHVVEIDKEKYDVVFLPLIGMNNILEGYMISYSKANNIPTFILFFPYLVSIIILGTVLILIFLKIIKDKTEELSFEKDWLNQINNSLYEGLYVTDENSDIEYINSKASEILGYEKDELIGKNAHYLFHYHDKNNYLDKEDCVILNGIKSSDKFNSDSEYFKLKNGKLIPIEIFVQKLVNDKKEYIVTTFRDLSIKKELESKQYMLNIALTSCSDSIVITNKDANVLWINPAFEQLTGYKLKEIEGKNHSEFTKSGMQTIEFYEEMWDTILNKQPWKGELVNRKKDKTLYNEALSITPILDYRGDIEYFIAIKQDITEKKYKQDEIEYFANYDFLTNLPNRRRFDIYFDEILESLKINKKHMALLFLDLDKFKLLNDSKGHDYGDILLKEFSIRIKKIIRNIDFVARLGGDEFVIVLDNLPLDIQSAKNICEKISLKILKDTRKKFLLKEYEYKASTSIGIYIFKDFNETKENIIKKSDEALYEAKKNGRDRYFISYDL